MEAQEHPDANDSPDYRVRQEAGDRAVQAAGDVTGAVATGDHAIATFYDNSTHYHSPTLPLKGDGVRTREQASYLERLEAFLSAKAQGAAGPLFVQFGATDEPRMSTAAELVEQCTARGRLILRGPAGAGKSFLLRRSAQQSLQAGGVIPVLLDLSKWKPTHSKAMGKIGESTKARRRQIAVILRTSVVPVNQNTIDGLLDRNDVLLVIDGLNEVGSQSTAGAILNAIDAYLEQHPLNLAAVVADRAHHDGSSDLTPWDEFELDPLTRSTVEGVLAAHFTPDVLAAMTEDDWTLLTSPFFLEQAVSLRQPVLGSAETSLEAFYAQQVRLSPEDVDRLSQMAFEMYRRSGRTATLAFARKWLTDTTADRLISDGTLTTAGAGEVHFDHQIKHDFLAARHLGSHSEEWNSEAFNQITFSASSVDVLRSTLTMLPTALAGDNFLKSIYNWHWLPAIKTAGSFAEGAGSRFSKEAETWLACCAAEKVLDPLIWTSEATKRLLLRLNNPLMTRAAYVTSPEDIVRLSHEANSHEEWFVQWRSILDLGQDRAAGEDYLQMLAGSDPVVGWAVSNAAKRWSLDESDFRQLRSIYRSTRDSDVRWRVVHTLGAFISPANIELLFDALDEPQSEWVRYGAIRSLVELAISANNEARNSVLGELSRRLGSLTSRLQLKLGEAVFVSRPPSGWTAAVAPLLQEASIRQEVLVDIDRWQILLRQFDRYEQGMLITPPGR